MKQRTGQSSKRLLIFTGILWLCIAVIILVYQLYIPINVNVTWSTATEVDTAGFYVYRSQEIDGEYLLLNEGDGLIPAQGNAITGADYLFTDQVTRGATYYYLLEEVEYSGNAIKYEEDIIPYTIPAVHWLSIVAAVVSIIIGTIIIITALKESEGYDT